MKKITIALVCMLLTAGAAMAQKKFTFGPKIGVDYTHFWGKDEPHGGQLNYQGGVFFEILVGEKIAIAPEVVFAAQGGRWKGASEVTINEGTHTEHVNYINVPVMLKYYVIPSLSIDFGPQVGYCIYSKFTEEENGIKNTWDQMDITKKVDVGVGLGLTYNIAKDVFVQGRYTMGVTNAFKSGNYKNSNAQIAIGYRF